jgi:F-type H+-transporting ATPase subunit a
VIFLAEQAPVTHPFVSVCGDGYWDFKVLKLYYCGFTSDTVLSSAVAIVVTLALGFWLANRLQSRVPGKLQMVFELALDYVRRLLGEQTAGEGSQYIFPIAATIGFYILVANWLDFLPLSGIRGLRPANSAFEQTAAMAVVVIIVVQAYSLRVLGLRGYLRRFTKPFELPWIGRILYIPINIIEEVTKPITLALRLFGNIFAGVVMVYLITLLLPVFVAPVTIVVWKFFDVFFVGTIQAFIFMLLTIIYFGMAREGLEHEGQGHDEGRVVRGRPPLPKLKEETA